MKCLSVFDHFVETKIKKTILVQGEMQNSMENC